MGSRLGLGRECGRVPQAAPQPRSTILAASARRLVMALGCTNRGGFLHGRDHLWPRGSGRSIKRRRRNRTALQPLLEFLLYSTFLTEPPRSWASSPRPGSMRLTQACAARLDPNRQPPPCAFWGCIMQCSAVFLGASGANRRSSTSDGLGRPVDYAEAAVALPGRGLRRRPCLGLHQSRLPPPRAKASAGRSITLSEAARLYQTPGCDGGGCRGLHQSRLPPRAKGLGRPVDYTEAARLYQMGCDGGHALGCTNLGVLHRQGLGRPVDYAEAARLYQHGLRRRQCPRAAPISASSTRQGLGRPVDYAEAARLYQMGCDGGNALGCSNLGVVFRRGYGVEIDLVEALRLFDMACDHGCKNAPVPSPARCGRSWTATSASERPVFQTRRRSSSARRAGPPAGLGRRRTTGRWARRAGALAGSPRRT